MRRDRRIEEVRGYDPQVLAADNYWNTTNDDMSIAPSVSMTVLTLLRKKSVRSSGNAQNAAQNSEQTYAMDETESDARIGEA